MYAKVEQYIFFALKKYRQINLPGYGVLEIIKKEAQSHPVHHEYEAPGEHIQFSPNAAHGKDLADCLAKDADLTSDKANDIINSFFKEFTAKLETTNKAELKGIGVFFEKGKILHFQAEADVQLTPESYGLFGFKAMAPKKQKTVTPKKPKEKKKRKVPAFIYVLLFLGVAITAAFFVFPEESNEVWQKAISIFDKSDEQDIANNNNSTDSSETDTVAVINTDTLDVDTLETDTVETNITEANHSETNSGNNNNNTYSSRAGTFHVIANCFSMKELADNYVANLKSQGFSQANILGVNSSGLHVVSFNTGFATKDEARKYMREVQSKTGRTDLWVHCHNCN
ncbi:MAG: hypothetical protein C0592_03680 [Marinilabiliales bacterium]|nr:MAG: hypothetical protein C0592_03680 [Marinilabiliales bacterium]